VNQVPKTQPSASPHAGGLFLWRRVELQRFIWVKPEQETLICLLVIHY